MSSVSVGDLAAGRTGCCDACTAHVLHCVVIRRPGGKSLVPEQKLTRARLCSCARTGNRSVNQKVDICLLAEADQAVLESMAERPAKYYPRTPIYVLVSDGRQNPAMHIRDLLSSDSSCLLCQSHFWSRRFHCCIVCFFHQSLDQVQSD